MATPPLVQKGKMAQFPGNAGNLLIGNLWLGLETQPGGNCKEKKHFILVREEF